MKQLQRNARNYQAGTTALDLPLLTTGQFIGFSGSFAPDGGPWPAGVDYMQPDGSIVPNAVLVVRYLGSRDGGLTWEQLAATVATNEVTVHPRTGQSDPPRRFVGRFDRAQTGRMRVEAIVLVPLRMVLTLTLLELGD